MTIFKTVNQIVGFIFICLLFFCPQMHCQENSEKAKVIVIGVDGLSVNGLQKAQTPNMDLMMEQGSFTLNGQAVLPSKSSPNWMSMMSGVGPEKHLITKNGFDKDVYTNTPTCPNHDDHFPTIFTLLRTQRPTDKTALIHQWPAFKKLLNLDELTYRKNKILSAKSVAKTGIRYYKKEQPSLLFLHFNLVDAAGHLHGYAHKKYVEKVEKMDDLLEKFIELAQNEPNLYILLVSDHGGIGKNHGGDTPEELTVPVIIFGQNIDRKQITKPVSNIDIAPTIVDILGLEPHECWEGTSVLK